MGTRADFYIGIRKPKWIGSIFKDGHPWNIPCKILVQNNPVMYEEYVIDFLKMRDPQSAIASEGHPWQWPWEDSRMTDYSYFLAQQIGAVYAYSMTEKMAFYPLKIMQGEDLNAARVLIGINFPNMGVGYGPDITKAV